MAVIAGFLLISPAIAGKNKLSPDLKKPGGATIDVIIRYKTPPGEKEVEKLKQMGGKGKQLLGVSRALLAEVNGEQLDELAADPEVEYISPDRELAAFVDYGRPAVNAVTARQQYPYTGKGVGVAEIAGRSRKDRRAGRLAIEDGWDGGVRDGEEVFRGVGTRHAKDARRNTKEEEGAGRTK